MAQASTSLDLTTATLIIGIAFCATCSVVIPAAIAEWKVKRRNDKILADIAKRR